MMRTSMVLATIVMVLAFSQDRPQKGRVQKPAANVDFSHYSGIDKTPDNKFILTNYIQNHSSGPLSVQWREGGIICIGLGALPKDYKDSGRETGRIIEKPVAISSDIKYGAKLNYSAPAQVYINPERETNSSAFRYGEGMAEPRETLFERRDAENRLIYSIRVISKPDRRGTSHLTIEVEGGLSIAIGVATEIDKRQDWGFDTPPVAFADLRFTKESRDDRVLEWMKTSEDKNVPHFYVLPNRGTKPTDFVGTLEGVAKEPLVLKRIKILAFKPGEEGFIGFNAAIYLPRHARIW